MADRISLYRVYARRHETTATFTAKSDQDSISAFLVRWLELKKKTSDTHQIQLPIRLQDTLYHILRKDRMRTYLRASSEGSPLYQATADRESSRRS